MASLLSVSRSAVVAAYEQLMAEGYVCGRAGSGTYVSPELSEFADGYGAFAKKRSITDARTTEPEPANNDLVDVTVHGRRETV